MDVNIAGWILEFLLRQPIEDSMIATLLNVLPLSNDDNRLMKSLLLRRICSEISKGSVPEKTLEILEMIEEYDFQHGIDVLESMKEAYCAVAVHCTVVCLKENPEDFPNYFDAIVRIWRGRIHDMERWERVGLVSDKLKQTRAEIEQVLWNANVRNDVLRRDTLNDALQLLRVFLADATEKIGPSILEIAATTMNFLGKEVPTSAKNSLAEQTEEREVPSSDVHREEVEVNIRAHLEHTGNDMAMDKNLVAEQTEGRGASSSDVHREEVEVNIRDHLGHTGNDMAMDKNLVAEQTERRGASSSDVPREEVEVNSGDHLEHTGSDKAVDTNLAAGQTEGRGAPSSDVPPEDFDVNMGDHLGQTGGDMALDSSKEIPSAANRKYKPISTPEVRKVQEALKSSTLELQAVVRDPLPDALQFAATISASIAREGGKDSLESQNGADKGKGVPCTGESVKAVGANEANIGNQGAIPRPSLMVRNSTARTFEWDEDSIEDSAEGSSRRPHLPTPKKRVFSPLAKDEARKNTRRKKKMWSALEEQTLRDAVKECGRGNWKIILDRYHDTFEERTVVDLKDKWRNMTR